jgi:hypothetical protein
MANRYSFRQVLTAKGSSPDIIDQDGGHQPASEVHSNNLGVAILGLVV